jgi:membrane-associated protease RseP (regulator of RpoE activity)
MAAGKPEVRLGVLKSAMDANELNPQPLPSSFESPRLTLVDAIPEFAIDYPPPPPPVRRIWLPVFLFFTTCVSTFVARVIFSDHFPEARHFPKAWWFLKIWWPAILDGLMYSGAAMTILLCHEMGHFVQAWRYGVYASLPYFLPVPLPPIGTFGAVIFMEPRQGDRKAVFDIGISGPLAGLVPTFLFLCIGLSWSQFALAPAMPGGQGEQLVLGEPLLMQYFSHWLKGPTPASHYLLWHPFALAGWVGLLITSINLIPIGQLDGGHILYGMFRKKAHVASIIVLVLAITLSIRLNLTNWWLMLGVITVLGTRHPPTADDSVPLGAPRYVLGLLTLAFLFLGFTPRPLSFLGH